MQLYSNKYSTSSKLLQIIDIYWVLENNTNMIKDIPIVPDGYMDIVYYNDELLLVGSFNKGITIQLESNSKVFGIRFKPSILPQLLDIKANDFTNKIIPLKDVSKELFLLLNFNEKIKNNKVIKLNNIFEDFCKEVVLNQVFLEIINEIDLKKGNISIKEISQFYNINQRQLERLFKRLIGFSPKNFTNIIRFFYIFKNLLKTGFDELASKALDFGYCDQAHFNKEFKKISNITPTADILSVLYNTKK